jgi:hypothetical protein
VLPDFALHALRKLADGRWLATGQIGGGFAAATLDPATLAPMLLPVRGRMSALGATMVTAQLADGRVVLGGPGIPLAAYDPHTWRPGLAIANASGYPSVIVDSDAVIITSLGKATRYPLAPELGADDEPVELKTLHGTPAAAAHGVLVIRTWSGNHRAVAVRRADGTELDLPGPVDAVALSGDAARVATLTRGELRVVRIADNTEIAAIALGDGARASPASIALDGDRAIVAAGTVLRVVDLAHRTASPDLGPPYGYPRALAVGDDGAITALGMRAWRFDATTGAVHTGPDLGERTAIDSPAGVVERYADLADGDPATLIVHDAATGSAARTYDLAAAADSAWLAADGEVAVAERTSPSSLWRSAHGELQNVLSYGDNVFVDDVDSTTGFALLAVGGEANVIRLADQHAVMGLPFPSCDTLGNAALERGGRRAYTLSDPDIYVWDRVSGDLVASLHLPDAPWNASAAFVPGHDELLVERGLELALWQLRTGELRTIAVGSAFVFAVSPSGKRAALVLADGRTALVDLDVVRERVPATAASPPPEPKLCLGGDPIVQPPPPPESPPDAEGPYSP